MPASQDDLLTPTEHQAAQLLVLLAWRLERGQLGDADRLLAKLCAIPINEVAMAGIVLLREIAHSMTAVLGRSPSDLLGDIHAWLLGQAGASG
jgi:hypothetical protein